MSGFLKNKKILLGVCGSIAAYKAACLTRLLVKEGAEVKVIMTHAATTFVQPLTFATLSKNECLTSYTRNEGHLWNNHVDLALWADVFLIAPASVGTIAKLAHAICDNLLIGTYLSARCPVIIAPAMDEDMYHHPANQENLQKLKGFGNHIISVEEGELASGLFGKGRMAEPETIVDFLSSFFTISDSPISGKNILITAGPTYEHLDPVRFIGNSSSGKMGIALAEVAAQKGAKVTLILGPSSLKPKNKNIEVVAVVSAAEMYQKSKEYFEDLDIAIFAAAVADYTPDQIAEHKIKKGEDIFTLKLKKNIDIAASFGLLKKAHQLSIGFALETQNEESNAKDKLKRKHFDLIVLNSLADKGAGFKHDTNKITILDRHLKAVQYDLKEKTAVAEDIIEAIENQLS
ncbi:MAG TPA: bifunctional phosphopantothenoylcysteine decarboxylase/phosphopantothenate--cysteine ligase CoaBC [Chitinophagales bacterium]|nr:bifunctional phosphopantothenoylcysteine decarboxylase/phosphopantothenate--cysteine ligase CoaBC [Chitinophagales bacterium]